MKIVLLLVSNTKVREFPGFQGISWSMKSTKGQTCSEPDVGMRFTAKISNVWAQTNWTYIWDWPWHGYIIILFRECNRVVLYHSLFYMYEITTSMASIFSEFVNWHLSRLVTKPTKWHVCPAKTQISLGITWAHSEDSDQTGCMLRLIWVLLGAQSLCWFCHETAHFCPAFRWGFEACNR